MLLPVDWLEERSGLVGGIKYFLFRKVPAETSWFHTLGSATLTAFLVQAVTGVILAMYYQPAPAEAYESIQHITNDLTLGWLVRGMHRWGASVFIILLFLHMGRVFLFGAYKYPRELNWLIGVLLLTLGAGGGPHRLPAPVGPDGVLGDRRRDQHQRNAPIVGPYLGEFLRGGAEIGNDTLARFYSMHMLADPGRLIRAHRAAPLSRRAPRDHPAAVVEGGRRLRGGRGRAPASRGSSIRSRAATAPSPREGRGLGHGAQRRQPPAEFKLYKEDVKRRGKPFFPYAMFHDTVMSFVVVSVIIGLACIWYFTSGEEPGDSGSSARATRRGRPGHDAVHPAARLVLLLPLLPPADLQVARVGHPGDGRDPDAPPHPPDRGAVHRPAPGAADRAPPGRGGRRAARHRLDGRPHLQGRDRQGVARQRERRARPAVGGAAATCPPTERRAPRSSRWPAAWAVTPTSARARRTSARPISPTRARRARRGVPDRPPQVPELREPGLADAALPELHGRAVPAARGLPRGVEGPAGRRRGEGLALPERGR